jgi:hypothetical protein
MPWSRLKWHLPTTRQRQGPLAVEADVAVPHDFATSGEGILWSVRLTQAEVDPL